MLRCEMLSGMDLPKKVFTLDQKFAILEVLLDLFTLSFFTAPPPAPILAETSEVALFSSESIIGVLRASNWTFSISCSPPTGCLFGCLFREMFWKWVSIIGFILIIVWIN